MELEKLKSEWQKCNEHLNEDDSIDNTFILLEKKWFNRNKEAINAFVCLLASILLCFVLIHIRNNHVMDTRNLIVVISGFIIAIYIFFKGVFTFLFFLKKNRLDVSVGDYLLIKLNNQLFFIYEWMLWLWILLPLILISLPCFVLKFIDIPENTIGLYSFSVGLLYLVCIVLFSKRLWRKKCKISREIKKMSAHKS